MGLTSRAAVLDGVGGKFSVAEAPVPDPAPGSIIVKQELCGVCGTDVHICRGHMPRVRSRVVLGHGVVGRVVAGGEGVTADCTGRPLAEGDLIGIKPGVSDTTDYFA